MFFSILTPRKTSEDLFIMIFTSKELSHFSGSYPYNLQEDTFYAKKKQTFPIHCIGFFSLYCSDVFCICAGSLPGGYQYTGHFTAGYIADPSSDAADTDTAGSDQEGSPSDIPYEKGTLTDTDYESTWLNLKFTPPSTVIMNTEEEMQSVMQQGQASLSDSTGVELNEDSLSGTVYE